MTIEDYFSEKFRVARTQTLLEQGFTPAQIRYWVQQARLVRIRKGWYCSPQLPNEAVEALRVGGQLCGPSAAKAHGLWVPPFDGLHISVPKHSSRLRPAHWAPPAHEVIMRSGNPLGLKLYWDNTASLEQQPIEPVMESIARILYTYQYPFGFAVLESALFLRRISPEQCNELLGGLPKKVKKLMLNASYQSESGTESLFKFRLLLAKIPFRQQVKIPGVGRVDFLLGEKLVVEIDSFEHHQNQYRDRSRDSALHLLGYRIIRFIYRQIVHEPEQVFQVIDAALQRNDHR